MEVTHSGRPTDTKGGQSMWPAHSGKPAHYVEGHSLRGNTTTKANKHLGRTKHEGNTLSSQQTTWKDTVWG